MGPYHFQPGRGVGVVGVQSALCWGGVSLLSQSGAGVGKGGIRNEGGLAIFWEGWRAVLQVVVAMARQFVVVGAAHVAAGRGRAACRGRHGFRTVEVRRGWCVLVVWRARGRPRSVCS